MKKIKAPPKPADSLASVTRPEPKGAPLHPMQPMKGLLTHEPPRWSILSAQRTLQKVLFDAGKLDREPGYAASYAELLDIVRFNLEALNAESVELLDNLPWKKWKTYEQQPTHAVDYETITEMRYELVDMLHFIMNIAIGLDMDWNEIERIYYTKHIENLRRVQEGY